MLTSAGKEREGERRWHARIINTVKNFKQKEIRAQERITLRLLFRETVCVSGCMFPFLAAPLHWCVETKRRKNWSDGTSLNTCMDIIKRVSGWSFWVCKVKPIQKCLKFDFFLKVRRRRLPWFQNEK